MWKKFANNPRGKAIGDCAVRAISAALGLSWYEAFDLLTAEAKRQADMPSADSVWGAVLRSNGFSRHALSNYPTENPTLQSGDRIGDYGDSDFLQTVKGKSPETVWAVMDELMDTLAMVNHRVYDGVMRKLQ